MTQGKCQWKLEDGSICQSESAKGGMQQIALKNPETRQKEIKTLCSEHYVEWLSTIYAIARIRGMID